MVQALSSSPVNPSYFTTTAQPNQHRIRAEIDRIWQLAQEFHPNLFEAKQAADELREQAHNLPQHEKSLLNNELARIDALLSLEHNRQLLSIQTKWIKAGFDPELIRTDPQAVAFSVESKLIYTIKMFSQAQTALAPAEIGILKNRSGKALFKMQDKWVTYEELKKTVHFDKAQDKFPGWSYRQPSGFVPHDVTAYNKPIPIAKVNTRAYQNWLHQAKKLWSTNLSEIDPNEQKDSILLITTTGNFSKTNNPLLKSFSQHFPEHCSIRLIDKEQNLFSLGVYIPQKQTDCSDFLTSDAAHLISPDFEENRNNDVQRVTAVAITSQRCADILSHAEKLNSQNGFHFNLVYQNCVRFAQSTAHLAGLTIDTKEFTPTFVYKLLPKLHDIPALGTLVHGIKVIASLVSTLLFDFSPLRPRPIEQISKIHAQTFNALIHKVQVVFTNTIYACLGLLEKNAADTPHQFTHWLDLFNETTSYVMTSYKLKEWQKKQLNTLYFYNNKTSLCIDPEQGSSPA